MTLLSFSAKYFGGLTPSAGLFIITLLHFGFYLMKKAKISNLLKERTIHMESITIIDGSAQIFCNAG
jgi:hypothetical protein